MGLLNHGDVLSALMLSTQHATDPGRPTGYAFVPANLGTGAAEATARPSEPARTGRPTSQRSFFMVFLSVRGAGHDARPRGRAELVARGASSPRSNELARARSVLDMRPA